MFKYLQPKKLATGLLAASLIVGCSADLTDVELLQRAKDFQDEGKVQSAIVELKNAASKNPQNIEVRWLLGKLYVELRDGESAEKELQKAIELGLDISSADVSLARAWLLQGQYQKVLDSIQVSASDGLKRKVSIYALRGDGHRGLGNLELAAKSYNNAIALDDTAIEPYLGMAQLQFTKNALDRAESYLQFAKDIDSENPLVLQIEGDLFYSLKEYSEAERVYLDLLDKESDSLKAKLGLALVYLSTKELEKAIDRLDQILNVSSSHVYSNYLRSLAAFELERYEEAKQYTSKALNQFSGHLPSLLIEGASNFALGEYEQAIRRLERVLGAAPGHEYVRRLLGSAHQKQGNDLLALEIMKPLAEMEQPDSELLASIGSLAIKAGRIKEGSQYLADAALANPDDVGIRLLLGESHMNMDDIEKGIDELSAAVTLSDSVGGQHFALVQALISAKRYDEALQQALALKEQMPDNPMADVMVGISYLEMTDYANAEQAFNDALSVNPDMQDASFNLALLYSKTNRLDAAAKILDDFLQRQPDSQLILAARARLAAKQGELGTSRLHLERLVEKYPEDSLAIILLSRVYLVSGEPQKALDQIQAVDSSVSDDLSVLEIKGRAQYAAGQYQEAVQTLYILTNNVFDSPAAHYLLAKALVKTGETDKAEAAFKKAQGLAPDSVKIAVGLIQANLEQNDLVEAEQLISKYNRVFPEDMTLIYQAAKLAQLKGDALEAISLMKRVHQTFDQTETALSLSKSYLMTGDFKQAEAVLTDMSERNPESQAALLQLAAFYQTQGNYTQAINSYEKLIAVDANNWVYRNDLAMSLLRSGRNDEGLKQAQAALRINPKSVDVMDTYALLLNAEGDYKGAQEQFEKAIKAAPENFTLQLHLAQSKIAGGQQRDALDILNRLQTKPLSKPLAEQVSAAIESAQSN